MPSADQLNVLNDLADDKCEAALRVLAQMRQGLAAAQEQLGVLTRYSQDYQARMSREVAGGGLHSEMLRNYQAFIARIAAAIAQQELEVKRRQALCSEAEQAWREAQRQLESYRTLARREQVRVRREADRRQQKLDDESAARMGAFGVRTTI